MPRFEVVSAPIEERVESTLRYQATIALQTLRSVFEAVAQHRTDTFAATRRVLSDDAFVTRIAAASVALLLPNSLPGFLVTVCVILKCVHVYLVHVLARRALAAARAARHKSH
jgi:hypothetical protein